MLWYNLKYRIKAFFYFSNTETKGLLVLVLWVVFVVVAPRGYKLYYSLSAKPEHTETMALLERHVSLLQAHVSQAVPIDINRATVEQLMEIVGMTYRLACRVIHYRDKLGGFVLVDQYREVYGMPDHLQARLLQQTIITSKYKPKQLSLNHASFKALVSHPYITPAMARSIVAYRQKVAKITTLAIVNDFCGQQPALYKKLIPYLSL